MRTLYVEGDENFQITIPDDAKVTFSPWSPPKRDGSYRGHEHAAGTLRIYKGTKDNIIACFSGVITFRDTSMGFRKQIAKEEGATIWKDDEEGYVRENKVYIKKQWATPQLEGEIVKAKKKKK